MARKRVEALKDIVNLQERIGNYFESEGSSIPTIARTWTPSIDLYETDDNIFITADIAGVEEKDVKIEVQNNFITIQGQRRLEKKDGEDFIRMERNYGPFQRTFRLPANVMEDEMQAEFRFGVLKITMRKGDCPGNDYVRIKIDSNK